MSPDELFQHILPKLEKLRRQQETNELFERKLQENNSDIMSSDSRQMGPPQPQMKNNKNLAEAFREKFLLDDDNDQAILDQHVSRVWSDLTPSRSPGTMSPYQVNSRRRTTDPGFVDMRYSEGASSSGRHSYLYFINHQLFFLIINEFINFKGSHISMKHSKSMPEHSSSAKKLLSNKWPSMNTDSGISVFSTKVKTKEPRYKFNFYQTIVLDNKLHFNFFFFLVESLFQNQFEVVYQIQH